jgi:hypothetical protein
MKEWFCGRWHEGACFVKVREGRGDAECLAGIIIKASLKLHLTDHIMRYSMP